MTGEQSQQISLASGVKPDDNLVSSEILRMRHHELGTQRGTHD